MAWTWALIIPQSMLHLGGYLLLLSVVVQVITPRNSKVALWMSLIGGFGVGGGVGGFIGRTLMQVTVTAASFTQKITAQLVGTGFSFLLFAILAIVFWEKAGKGGSGFAGGKGKGSGKKEKIKQAFGLSIFAMLGTAIAAIPMVYSFLDMGVSTVGHVVTAALPGGH